jgi:hypothetical protein
LCGEPIELDPRDCLSSLPGVTYFQEMEKIMSYKKYKNIPTHIHGIRFDSAKEGKRYLELKIMERAGEITALELQPRYNLVIDAAPVRYTSPSKAGGKASNRVIYYKADFQYRNKEGNLVVEDVKGVDTAASKLKRALVEHMYRIKIDII